MTLKGLKYLKVKISKKEAIEFIGKSFILMIVLYFFVYQYGLPKIIADSLIPTYMIFKVLEFNGYQTPLTNKKIKTSNK